MAARGLIVAGATLIPWLIVLAFTLPSSATASHWAVAWAGLDAMEATGLLATGLLVAKRDERGRLTAMATATLLIADAWLDVMTAAAGPGQITAVAMAVLGELPMAGLCAAVALRRCLYRPNRTVSLALLGPDRVETSRIIH